MQKAEYGQPRSGKRIGLAAIAVQPFFLGAVGHGCFPGNDDEPGRLAEMVGVKKIIAIHFLNLQPLKAEHIREITGGKLGYFFRVGERLLKGGVVNRNFFIEMCFVIPAVNIINGMARFFLLIVHQMGFGPVHIEVIYYKNASRFQAAGDGADGIIVLPSCFKITETGKEIEGVIKIIGAEQEAHIMHKKFQVLLLELLGISNAVGRNINTGYLKTTGCKYFAVPAPATGYIQHTGLGRRLQMTNQLADKGPGFLFIPLKI